ncbi:MAG: hypothetical protein RMJ07_06415 [Nitrososphaerota archaeon]|nr:hypothetical protein [Candidatus Bathyarchaeota archaeon]MDW8049289.1 hypothetical protein [Nitrososphaerota archaeon]
MTSQFGGVRCSWVAVVCLTIVLGFLPFMQPRGEWAGYGSLGSHFYKNDHYEVHYGEASTGVGKPQIYVLISLDRVPLVEVSDQRSEVNWLRIYPNFAEVIRLDGGALVATYGGGVLVKRVEPSGDVIRILYSLSVDANLTITLWRWYYESVENVTKFDVASSVLPASGKLHFTFMHNGERLTGEIGFSPVPDEIVVYGDDAGLNKIAVSFIDVSKVSMSICANVSGSGRSSGLWSPLLLYPIIAAAVTMFFLVYSVFPLKFRLRMSRRGSAVIVGKGLLSPVCLALIAFAVRLILSPFFMHVWDVVTVHESLNEFASGRNVYCSVVERTLMLRAANGVEANYEGYAYLPHPLLIYMPFHLAYVWLFGGAPAMFGGHLSPLKLATPNIYVFLTLLKMPVILADAAITYILARKSARLGLFYAFLPYSIMITSVWGNFDSLVGLFLLLAFICRSERPLLSGLFYGLSLMKLYMAVVFPAFLFSTVRRRDTLVRFLFGLVISQVPTLIFFAQDPGSMLQVLLFHSVRSPGGVNLYHLAPKLYSYGFQSILNKVSIVALGLTVLAILMRIGSHEEGVPLSLAAYLAVGSVVNEQHLAALLPLLLFLGYEGLASFLSAGYFLYALFYSGPAYFMAPLATLSLGGEFVARLGSSWADLFGQVSPYILYALAVTCSLSLLSNICGRVATLRQSSSRIELQPQEIVEQHIEHDGVLRSAEGED